MLFACIPLWFAGSRTFMLFCSEALRTLLGMKFVAGTELCVALSLFVELLLLFLNKCFGSTPLLGIHLFSLAGIVKKVSKTVDLVLDVVCNFSFLEICLEHCEVPFEPFGELESSLNLLTSSGENLGLVLSAKRTIGFILRVGCTLITGGRSR